MPASQSTTCRLSRVRSPAVAILEEGPHDRLPELERYCWQRPTGLAGGHYRFFGRAVWRRYHPRRMETHRTSSTTIDE
jgi:hypothetical protein